MVNIALGLALILAPAVLEGKGYSFKLYSRQEGLRNQTINCLLQDRKGFLWAATDNGLYRYDGSRFSFFGRADGLPDETIQSLYENKDGTLWVGTRLGVASFDGKRLFTADPVLGKAELFGYSNIVSDAEGRMYAGTARGLAIRGKPWASGNPVSTTSIPEAIRFRFVTKSAVHGVYVDPSNRIWFGADGKLWQLENGVAVEMGKDSKLPVDRWDSMLEDREGTLWIRSSERLLFRRKGDNAFQSVPGIPHSPEFGSIFSTQDGHLFVPTIAGLMSYSEGKWERIGRRQGLVSDETTCVFQDREGSVWVGLGGEGLERWLGFNQWESWTAADGLTSDIIWDIERDSAGTLWTATEGGLHTQDRRSGDWHLKSGKGMSVRTLLEDTPHHSIWYGANPGGIYRLDQKTGRVQHFGVGAGLTNDRIDKLLWGADHDLWATTRAGLFRGKVFGDTVRFEREIPPYTDGNEEFFSGLLDHQGRLWVGGSRGVVVLEKGKWRRISTQDGLAGEGVSQLAEAADGAIWLGYLSNLGISRLVFNQDHVHFDHYTTKNGLTSNGIVFVNVDTRGWVWAGSDDGVDVYANSVWKHYGKTNGLVSDDCDSLAFHEDPDSSVWIGTSGGISHLRVFDSQPLQLLPVYITAISAGTRPLDPDEPGTIPYQDRSLLFHFAAPVFVNESTSHFKYRMVGLGQNWLDADERWVRYPNLTAGDYDFQVIAQNAGARWSSQPASVRFRIQAPWWKSWQIRILEFIFSISIARLLWRFRIRYLVKRQAVLETLLSQAKTANLLTSEALEKITKGETRERSRSYVLELISSHQPLEQVLDSIIDMVELDDPDTSCLILTIYDERFRHGSSRRLPIAFAKLFEGLPVNSPETCFALAASGTETIHVADLKIHPIWTNYVDQLGEMGMRCSRSAPILSSSSEVLGTITYFRDKAFVDEAGNLGSLENAERLASVAIEHLSLYEQLSHRAQHDLLTGLPNRAMFQERLAQSIVRAQRNDASFSVLWLDLDGFKHINDTLGHQTGDLLLKEIASRISGCLRGNDIAARMGGDEFTVILDSADFSSVEVAIQKLIVAISSPVFIGNQEVFVTASVGVSRFPNDSRDAGELVKDADLAMYHVKRLGKNAHQFFAPEMADLESSRIEIEGCLRNALSNREFELYYQPQFRLDGSLTGFEALLRWTNPKLGSISPARFIPVAETTGLIVPIGQWVLEEACRQTAEWNSAGLSDFRMAVNVSALQLSRPDFSESVEHLLGVMGVPAQQLELELTETAIMNDVKKSSGQLHRLRALGVTVSIDDFGTGYSSLSYLQRLPVDSIKIDQSFVRDIGRKPSNSLTMIQAIVSLAHGLGLSVVAEGVETEEQLEGLRHLGCDLAQGFLLAKPLTKLRAEELLVEHRRGLETDSEEVVAENLVSI